MPDFRILVPAIQMPHPRDVFLEAVADRQHFKYRLYHRPSGLVMQLTFAQRSKLPPYVEIVQALFTQLHESLILLQAEEEPFYAA